MVEYKDRELTICSVFHSPESQKLLELNGTLARALNPDTSFDWLVADNRQSRSGGKGIDPNIFGSLEGVPVPHEAPQPMRGSFHLAYGLNAIKKNIRTRFALFLDADCYVIRHSWIKDVLGHMKEQNLSFFGVPWHPHWTTKIRYFPGPHTLFVDLSKVSLEDIDFTPEPPVLVDKPFHFIRTLPLGAWWRRAWKGRERIGSSRDVGFPIIARFKNNPAILSECAQASFAPGDTRYPRLGVGRLLDVVLPDGLSYLPKRSGYLSHKHFRDLGYPDTASFGAEEFIWKEKPFAFHVRGNQSRIGYSVSFEEQYDAIASVVEAVIQKV